MGLNNYEGAERLEKSDKVSDQRQHKLENQFGQSVKITKKKMGKTSDLFWHEQNEIWP